jgi:hypothetical protein
MKIIKSIGVKPLFNNYEKTVHLFIDRNNAGLKKLSNFVWADKRLICLPKCHVSFNVCTQLWTEFFMFQSGLSDIRINCIRISDDLVLTSMD